MLRDPESRLRVVVALLVVVLALIMVRLIRLQIVDRQEYQRSVENAIYRTYALPEPPRGRILDRNGDLLVGNVPTYDVGAQLTEIRPTDVPTIAARLAPILGMDVSELVSRLRSSEYPWVYLARGVSVEVGHAITEALREQAKRAAASEAETKWDWLSLQESWQRYYAEGALAAHVLGFVNEEGTGYGVEAAQQRFLRPQPIVNQGPVNAMSEPLSEELARAEVRAYPGTDLVLTIDRTIQAFVEGELDKALVEFGAASGTILVMDPRTGAILASASRPHYRPYDYMSYGENAQDLFADPAISKVYEPGSVFKPFTVAAAVDSGRVTADWSYYDTGVVEYGGVTVQNWDRKGYGQQNLQGILDYSLNTGVATLTTRVMGEEIFYAYVRRFGFGQRTGIGLVGESSGIVHLPSDLGWQDGFLATNAFGQGIGVTPLQLATAATALANHGTMMAPYIVAERRYPDGRRLVTPPRVLGVALRPETADYVAELMANTVANRLKMAQVPGYRIAGKTGTAQIPTSGGYDPEDVITSFVGFGPLPDPQLLILVKLDRPQVPRHLRWGTQTAAPVFQRVASRVFVLLGIPPTEGWAGP